MRGAVDVAVGMERGVRIIPARAGSRSPTARSGTRSRDHPRACGEQNPGMGVKPTAVGSSPRVRGAGKDRWLRGLCDRIIPARAGSRLGPASTSRPHWDHPRACGEQCSPAPASRRRSGSSPRVRGAGHACHLGQREHRIIPARAGSSPAWLAELSLTRDHPRACGEQQFCDLPYSPKKGSSPRVRGAGVLSRIVGHVDGIIPARAGSRWACSASSRKAPDHPRACGEQRITSPLTHSRLGSSPRVRGAVTPTVHARLPNRIIPARAGSSHWKLRRGRWERDHPRACGEQLNLGRHYAPIRGSSPRVRGAADSRHWVLSICGIIPARAGSSPDW